LARDSLDAGRQLLRQAGDESSLGVLLCSQAECETLAGQVTAARAALDEAEAVARSTGTGATSELGLALRRVREMLSGRDAPEGVSRSG
jgi:hypothetical protein